MRPFERRAVGAFPYFKLAKWNDRNCSWDDGKSAYPTEAAAVDMAFPPGRFRVSRVDGPGRRVDFQPFEKGVDSEDHIGERPAEPSAT